MRSSCALGTLLTAAVGHGPDHDVDAAQGFVKAAFSPGVHCFGGDAMLHAGTSVDEIDRVLPVACWRWAMAAAATGTREQSRSTMIRSHVRLPLINGDALPTPATFTKWGRHQHTVRRAIVDGNGVFLQNLVLRSDEAGMERA